MTATPEGFLIAHNVPIARTGWYEYLGEEVGVPDKVGQIVNVYRSPEVVFSPAAMASFEGKVVTDDHPPEQVTPENATRYTRGAVQNVRQGTGEDGDLLLADLVIYDQSLIDDIQSGKREVSCGYDCTYEPYGDGYQQKQICGNHVAVVKSGRAGDRVAIKDSKSKQDGELAMGKIVLPKKNKSRMTDFLSAIGLKAIATDAEPEQIMDAVEGLIEERRADDSEEEPAAEATKDQDPAIAQLSEQVAKLAEVVNGLLAQKDNVPPSPEKAIDDEIARLEAAEDDEEESHTIPVEQFDEEGPVTDPEDRPQPALDNAYKIDALKAMKPIIAAISDPVERKRAADAALASIKTKPKKNAYAAIDKAARKKAADAAKAKDSGEEKDYSYLGPQIAAQHNPHYKAKA
ncbi:DUF2213 domain-containing protein [Paenibacillus filicis]|uniref:DUF2213 domain-containing protein n=1 Tax=Paenibacillus filicis TaxID=669464 RepID=A0ABU9DKR1_9BACL